MHTCNEKVVEALQKCTAIYGTESVLRAVALTVHFYDWYGSEFSLFLWKNQYVLITPAGAKDWLEDAWFAFDLESATILVDRHGRFDTSLRERPSVPTRVHTSTAQEIRK